MQVAGRRARRYRRPVEVRLLGTPEVEVDGRPIAIASAKERGLLALLALAAGHVVSSARLLDDLWEGAPPASGAVALRVIVSRLRRTLGSDGCAIVSQPPGYVLDIDGDDVDTR